MGLRRLPAAILGVASIALAALASAGCVARADRFAEARRASAEPVAAARRALPAASPGERGGYATFGPGVRLRTDTPPLARVLEARAREAFEEALAVEEALARRDGRCAAYEGEAYGAAGPGGDLGAYGGVGVGSCAGPVCGGTFGGGRAPASPFARALHATPYSDTYDHRPGLSVGSGVYGRRH